MSRWVLALAATGFALAPARAADPRPVWEFDSPGNAKTFHSVRWVGFTPDGKQLVAQFEERPVGNSDKTSHRLRVWGAATRNEILNREFGHGAAHFGTMPANAITNAGTLLVAAGGPCEVRLADGARSDGVVRAPTVGVWFDDASRNSLWLLDYGPEGYGLAHGKLPPFAADPKASMDAKWVKVKLPNKWQEYRPTVAASGDVTRFAVSSRDQRELALYNVTADDKLKLTEVATVKPTHVGWIESMQFSPDGKTLATADGSASLFLWDVAKAGKDWTPRATIPIGNFPASALAFSPDGRTLTAGTLDKKGRPNLYLIDVAGGKPLASYALPGQLTAAAYSPDSKTLVIGNNLGRIQAWDAEKLRNP